jgi:hypothetical protein
MKIHAEMLQAFAGGNHKKMDVSNDVFKATQENNMTREKHLPEICNFVNKPYYINL